MKNVRKPMSLVVAIAMILTMIPIGMSIASAADPTWTGTGTEADPYVITTYAQLGELSTAVKGGNKYEGKYFALANDITADTATTAWTSIGTSASNNFDGVFNGKGFKISGLTSALFGYTGVSSVIENLGITGGSVKASGFGMYYTGSLANDIYGTVKDCWSDSAVSVTGKSNLASCYTGGLVGYAENDSLITDCFFAGTLYSDGSGLLNQAGGIVGATLGTVKNCYNTGKITGQSGKANGIAGMWYYDASNTTPSSVANCYYLEGSAMLAYTKSTTTHQTVTVSEASSSTTATKDKTTDTLSTSDSGVLTDTQMKAAGSFTGFDFTNTWTISATAGDYPYPTLKAAAYTKPADNTTDFAGGNGTLYDPYQITTIAQLENVKKDLSANYILENDLTFYDYMYSSKADNQTAYKKQIAAMYIAQHDTIAASTTIGSELLGQIVDSSLFTNGTATDAQYEIAVKLLNAQNSTTLPTLDSITAGQYVITSTAAGYSGFVPIGITGNTTDGYKAAVFTGSFNGNGHVINNLDVCASQIDSSDDVYAGLFAENAGNIYSLSVISSDNTTSASLTSSSDYKLYATYGSGIFVSSVSSNLNEGLITGKNIQGAVISNCASDGQIFGTSLELKANAGGIAGYNAGIINSCENSSLVQIDFTSYKDATQSDNKLDEVYANSVYNAGGIAGLNTSSGVIKSCKNTGLAQSTYITNSLTDNVNSGAICGKNEAVNSSSAGLISNTYWTGSANYACEYEKNSSGTVITDTTGATADYATVGITHDSKFVGVLFTPFADISGGYIYADDDSDDTATYAYMFPLRTSCLKGVNTTVKTGATGETTLVTGNEKGRYQIWQFNVMTDPTTVTSPEKYEAAFYVMITRNPTKVTIDTSKVTNSYKIGAADASKLLSDLSVKAFWGSSDTTGTVLSKVDASSSELGYTVSWDKTFDKETAGTYTATITVPQCSAAEKSATVAITVSADPTALQTTTTSSYALSTPADIGGTANTDKFLTGITHDTPLSTIKSNIQDNAYLKLYKDDGTTEITDTTTLAATGQIIKLVKTDGTVIDSATVVVTGDTSGDGKVAANDARKQFNHISSATLLKGPYFLAGELSGDNAIAANDARKTFVIIAS